MQWSWPPNHFPHATDSASTCSVFSSFANVWLAFCGQTRCHPANFLQYHSFRAPFPPSAPDFCTIDNGHAARRTPEGLGRSGATVHICSSLFSSLQTSNFVASGAFHDHRVSFSHKAPSQRSLVNLQSLSLLPNSACCLTADAILQPWAGLTTSSP
jgi:hypothetical protein